MIAATASLLVGTGAVIEQFVKAQSMTVNTTNSASNMTETMIAGVYQREKHPETGQWDSRKLHFN